MISINELKSCFVCTNRSGETSYSNLYKLFAAIILSGAAISCAVHITFSAFPLMLTAAIGLGVLSIAFAVHLVVSARKILQTAKDEKAAEQALRVAKIADDKTRTEAAERAAKIAEDNARAEAAQIAKERAKAEAAQIESKIAADKASTDVQLPIKSISKEDLNKSFEQLIKEFDEKALEVFCDQNPTEIPLLRMKWYEYVHDQKNVLGDLKSDFLKIPKINGHSSSSIICFLRDNVTFPENFPKMGEFCDADPVFAEFFKNTIVIKYDFRKFLKFPFEFEQLLANESSIFKYLNKVQTEKLLREGITYDLIRISFAFDRTNSVNKPKIQDYPILREIVLERFRKHERHKVYYLSAYNYRLYVEQFGMKHEDFFKLIDHYACDIIDKADFIKNLKGIDLTQSVGIQKAVYKKLCGIVSNINLSIDKNSKLYLYYTGFNLSNEREVSGKPLSYFIPGIEKITKLVNFVADSEAEIKSRMEQPIKQREREIQYSLKEKMYNEALEAKQKIESKIFAIKIKMKPHEKIISQLESEIADLQKPHDVNDLKNQSKKIEEEIAALIISRDKQSVDTEVSANELYMRQLSLFEQIERQENVVQARKELEEVERELSESRFGSNEVLIDLINKEIQDKKLLLESLNKEIAGQKTNQQMEQEIKLKQSMIDHQNQLMVKERNDLDVLIHQLDEANNYFKTKKEIFDQCNDDLARLRQPFEQELLWVRSNISKVQEQAIAKCNQIKTELLEALKKDFNF